MLPPPHPTPSSTRLLSALSGTWDSLSQKACPDPQALQVLTNPLSPQRWPRRLSAVKALRKTLGLIRCVSSTISFFFFFSGVINAKNVHLDTRWIIMVVPLICIVIFACLCVRRKKLAGFLSSYLLLLQDSRDVESAASIRCCLGVPIMTQR